MDDGIDDSCMLAAHKADVFHRKLKPLILNSGAAASGYALKDRVKPTHAIKEKVLRKRFEGRSLYCAEDVKDVSGFRLVSLFNADITEALRLFLSLLTVPEQILGLSIDSVSEIEIHSNRKEGDPLSIVEAVRGVVSDFGLDGKLQVSEHKLKYSSYSSVHIILTQRFDEGGVTYTSSSEIQFRSIFEEAWSEISHRLGYGPEKRAAAEAAEEVLPGTPRWKPHLDALKAFADGCAQYSDLIASEAGWNASAGRPDAPPFATRSIDLPEGGWRAFYRTLPPEIFKLLETGFAQRDSAEAKAHAVSPPNGEIAVMFLDAAQIFEKAFEKVASAEPPIAMPQQLNGIKAEAAFCFMNTGNDELLAKSERMWREVHSSDPAFVPALLRLGQIRLRRHDYAEARSFLTAAEKEALSTTPAEGHRQRLFLIQRFLGIALWRISENCSVLGEKLTLLNEAVAASERAVAGAPAEDHKLVACCNALYCLADIVKFAPDQREKAAVRAQPLLETVRALSVYSHWSDQVWVRRTLDSLLRAERTFGDKAKAVEIGQEIVNRVSVLLDRYVQEGAGDLAAAFQRLSPDDQDIYLTATQLLRESATAAGAGDLHPANQRGK